MTQDQFVNKWRRHFLGILADCYATRKQPPSDLGMTMDRHTMVVEQMIRDIVNDIVADPPKPVTKEPTNDDDRQGKIPINNGQGGTKPPQPTARPGAQPASAGATTRR